MICLRYVEGKLREETGHPWGLPEVRLPGVAKRIRFRNDLFFSKRERRRIARQGRRFPIRVPKKKPSPMDHGPDVTRLVGHILSDGKNSALLYLPHAQDIGPEHLRDVEMWLFSHGKSPPLYLDVR